MSKQLPGNDRQSTLDWLEKLQIAEAKKTAFRAARWR
jgi:hypothetical protein